MLKIRSRYLEALEKEEFDQMPGRVYVRGFVRSYASFLGMDPGEALALLDEAWPEQKEEEPQPEEREKELFRAAFGWWKPRYVRYVLGVVAVALLFTLNLIWQRGEGYEGQVAEKSKVEEKAAPQRETAERKADKSKVRNEQKKEESTQQEKKEETAPRYEGVELVLTANRGQCWISVTADGRKVFEGMMNQNEVKTFKASRAVTVKLGNAGAVQVTYNGQDVGYLGGLGEVVVKEFAAAR
ncbi:MAG: hypothetical protein PWQ91_1055 [Eubacteriales bacterium]|nr:hypothetical protein [Eubacteriales bacterium]